VVVRATAAVLVSLVLALGLGACGGDPDVVDATPETQPTLTIPGGGAGAGALGEEPPPTTTTPDGEQVPDGTVPEGETPAGEPVPGVTEPGAAPRPGAAPDADTAPDDPTAEFGDFCEQNPGVPDC